MKRWIIRLMCIGFFCAYSGVSWAEVLASWDVDGVDVADGTGIDEGVSPYRFTSSSLAGNVSDAKLSLGSVSPTTTAGQYGFKISSTEVSLANAIAAAHFLEVSITVAAGYQMNFANIMMNGDVSVSGCDDIAFMSSIAGYVSGNELQALTGLQAKTGAGDLDTDSSGWGAPLDLTDSIYQSVIGTTTFRFYGWNSSGGTGVNTIRNLSGDDFVINGTITPIPEPATFALVGIGGLLAFFSRRRFLN